MTHFARMWRVTRWCSLLTVYLWLRMLSDKQVQAAPWKAQRPDVHLPGWLGISADCERSNRAFGAIWLAGRTLPDDLSACKGWLLMHSNTTEKAKPRVYSLISDQRHVACIKTRFPPDWGHRQIPSVSLCIIAFPLPPSYFCIIQDHPPYSSKMSARSCLLASIQTNYSLWGLNRWLQLVPVPRNPAGLP